MIARTVVPRTGRIKETEKIIISLQPTQVIEIGAGDYSFDYLIPKIKQPVSWQKVDFSPPCDIQMDLNLEKVTIPIPDNSQDIIIATEVFEHLLWPQSILDECRRILKPGGTILISVPNAVSLTYRIKWLMGGLPSCAACGNLPKLFGPTVYEKIEGGTIAGHVIDFNANRIKKLVTYKKFISVKFYGTGIFWHFQIVPTWLLPYWLSSNLLLTAIK
jgi:SAM-dependent methyltransferase